MAEPTNPHDALFKVAFSKPEAAASQLRALLPSELLAELDLAAIKVRPPNYIDPELRQSQSDLLFEVPQRSRLPALIHVIYEHQSTPDPFMPYRLLRYMLRVWEGWLERNKPKKPTRLPPVIPIVLYHGERAWNVPRSLGDMLDVDPDLLPVIQRHVPDFAFVLDDLSQRRDEELRARTAPPLTVSALVLFKWGREDVDLLAVWRSLADPIKKLQAEPKWTVSLQQLARYTLSVGDVSREDLARVARELAGPEAEETIMSTAEKLRQEGALQGRREVLLRQLRIKFGRDLPEAALARVEAANLDELDRWFERVLTASNLDEVFAE
ncbi:MAG: Rpn family recombination-promoting nuclease/putative transposase [Planctomycetota bacterium]|nr:MAG: Rpn family recombination-promoting nuclease/putative transposase [Planctomycetota bacterium]